MNEEKNHFSTRNLVLIGLFSAICYVALFFKIPIPAPVGKPFLHMGNMFVILAALLFSGPIGGLAGSIGMGFFDLTNGYVDSVPKTLLLKFGIGIITGAIATKGKKEDAPSPLKFIGVASIILIAAGIFLYIAASTFGNEIIISGIEKKLVVNPVLYIFSFCLGIGLLLVCIVGQNISIQMQYAILGAVCGIAFNLVGEFLFGAIKLLFAGSTFMPAIISSAISLPSTLINGTFSIVVALLLYVPVSKTLKKAGFLH